MRVRGFRTYQPHERISPGRAHMLHSHWLSSDQSFTLEDPAIFVATLEQFMFDVEVTPLKRAYTVNKVSSDDTPWRHGLAVLCE